MERLAVRLRLGACLLQGKGLAGRRRLWGRCSDSLPDRGLLDIRSESCC